MKYIVEMGSGGMIYVPSFMTIGFGIQVLLRLLLEQFERLQCWYYSWEGFMKYAVEMDSDAMIYLPSSIKIGSGIKKLGGYK
jgi:hypothetical protein